MEIFLFMMLESLRRSAMNDPIEKKFERAFSTAASTSPVFTHEAKQQMAKMVEAIARTRGHVAQRLATNQLASQKGGFLAEEFHALSFNLDSILKDKDSRAITDAYSQEWSALNRSVNDSQADLIIVKDGQAAQVAQLKYGKNAETTAGKGDTGFSQVEDGRPKYANTDTYIGPSDQVNPSNGGTSIKEHAEAAAYGNEARQGDPVQTEAYKATSNKIADRVQDDGVSSTPLSKAEANEMGGGNLSKMKQTEDSYQTQSTMQNMQKAACNAAAMSAVVSGAVNTVKYIGMARSGEITESEAVVKILAETAASAADSAVKSSAVVGVHSLMVRYGAKQVIVGTLAQQGFTALVRTNAVTVGVVCAVDAVKDLVSLGMGKMTPAVFFERQGKGVLNTSSGVVGGSLGALAAQAAASSLGIASTTIAPLLGGLAGGLIAGLAMQLAIENHIEKPYQDLVRNTQSLTDATRELQKAANIVFHGQVVFEKVIRHEAYLDSLFAQQLESIDRAGQRALSAINKI